LEEEINAMPALDDEGREMEPEDLELTDRLAMANSAVGTRLLVDDIIRVAYPRTLRRADVVAVLSALRHLRPELAL
jgi:hypothetical protein